MRYSAQQLTRFPHEYTTQREEALVLIIDYLIRWLPYTSLNLWLKPWSMVSSM